MNPESLAGRTDAVTKLWELKRLADGRVAQDMPMVHFGLLLSDENYRDGILEKASISQDPALAQLALALMELGLTGPLRSRPNGFASHSGALAADGITLGGGGGAGGSSRSSASGTLPLWLVMGLILTAFALVGGLWFAQQADGPRSVAVSDSLTRDTVWSAGNTYVLKGMIFVDGGARLTIEPGVTVQGEPGSALIVTREGRIHARGRDDTPVVFTSAKPAGQRKAGDWGGLVLLGSAPVNREGRIEGVDETDSRGSFGGDEAGSSCGVLDYVRIEFAGFEISKDNELNGLTLGGCGSGTIVRNVQVHRGLDDGIEVFGGTVDLQHIVVTGPGDDAFDWDMGWTGRVQHLLIQMHPDTGDNAFEGDNDKTDMDARPRSAPQFYNVTLINDPASSRAHRAMTIRRGSGGQFHNIIATGFNAELIDIRDEATARLTRSGELNFSAILAHASGADGKTPFPQEEDDDGGFSEARYFADGRVEIVGSVGMAREAIDIERPYFATAAAAYRLQPARPPQDEFWDEGADYFGAIRPGGGRGWTHGWTSFPLN